MKNFLSDLGLNYLIKERKKAFNCTELKTALYNFLFLFKTKSYGRGEKEYVCPLRTLAHNWLRYGNAVIATLIKHV